MIEHELCVMCKVETNEPVNKNIEFRNYYIECAGQLCKSCYDSLYFSKKELRELSLNSF